MSPVVRAAGLCLLVAYSMAACSERDDWDNVCTDRLQMRDLLIKGYCSSMRDECCACDCWTRSDYWGDFAFVARDAQGGCVCEERYTPDRVLDDFCTGEREAEAVACFENLDDCYGRMVEAVVEFCESSRFDQTE